MVCQGMQQFYHKNTTAERLMFIANLIEELLMNLTCVLFIVHVKQ